MEPELLHDCFTRHLGGSDFTEYAALMQSEARLATMNLFQSLTWLRDVLEHNMAGSNRNFVSLKQRLTVSKVNSIEAFYSAALLAFAQLL
jgi:hypothetical protein